MGSVGIARSSAWGPRLVTVGWRRSGHRRIAKRLQPADQDFGEFAVESAGAGLGQRIGRAERQRGDGLLGALFGKRGHDHDLGAGRGGNDPRNRFEPSRAGHFQIEQHDIDAAFAQRVDGRFGSPRDGCDFKCRIALDHARQDRPGDRRIVDDHQADPATRGPCVIVGIRKAVPRSGERPLHGSRP